MGLWDTITGRTRPKRPNLEALFTVPSAAITLQASLGLVPTGDGAVCYRAAAGAGFADAEKDVRGLIEATPDAPKVTTRSDDFGFTWLLVDHEPIDPTAPDLSGLCTDLNAVNVALQEAGYGSGLLCSLIPFTVPNAPENGAATLGLVYLYKQGTFYPFAPCAGSHERRDNLLEIAVRDALAHELPLEKDLSRWMALWGAPGL
jgi:hypothetical protein